jgi:hypothetical protein
LNIKKLTWLAQEGTLSMELRRSLLAHGLTESFGTDMAVDLMSIPEHLPSPVGLEIVRVETEDMLRQWIHVASIGFEVSREFEEVWFDFFAEAVLDPPSNLYCLIVPELGYLNSFCRRRGGDIQCDLSSRLGQDRKVVTHASVMRVPWVSGWYPASLDWISPWRLIPHSANSAHGGRMIVT